MTVMPTGRREARIFGDAVVFEREFRADIRDVWASIAVSERLKQWIGEWNGNPASGTVEFRMTAEGEDVAPETVYIEECTAPNRLRAHVQMGIDTDADIWHWDIELTGAADVTTLTFAQSVGGSIPVADVAPGWEYYLDRLVEYLTGGDVGAVNFERDYHPAMSNYYTALFGVPSRAPTGDPATN